MAHTRSVNPLSLLSATLILSLSSAFSPETPTSRRILALLDDVALRSSHSIFFGSLQSRGFDIDFKLADDPNITLHRYGQYLYDGLILFSPTTQHFGGSLNPAAIMDFVDSGHDMIIAGDSAASDTFREIATECGVDFAEGSNSMVIDHTSYAVSSSGADHTLIASDDLIESDVFLGSKKIEAPVLFQGIGHSVNPTNSLVMKVLSASPSAYSANPEKKLSDPPSLTGSAISLVSAVQARNNARVLISGSLSMFSDRFFRSKMQKARSSVKLVNFVIIISQWLSSITTCKIPQYIVLKIIYYCDRHAKSGNEQFLTEVSKWVFHERGHLKAVNVKHHKVGESDEPAMYRINDDLEYSVEIYEWSGKSWEPYVADDVQVQFYMMSPYVLKTYLQIRRVFILHHSRFQMFMAYFSSKSNTSG